MRPKPHQNINQVQAIQPRPFNHLNHWGVATITGNAHFMCSMDRKLDRKGGATPHPHQHHPVSQGPPSSTNHRPTTGSPPEVQKQSHKKTQPSQHQNVHIAFTKIPPHTPTPRLTSLPAWVEQLRLLTTLHPLDRRCLPSRPAVHTMH